MIVWVSMCGCSTLIPHAACCLTSFSFSVKSFSLSIFHCLLTLPSLHPLSVPASVFQLAQNLHLVLHNHLHCQTKQHGKNDACRGVLLTHVDTHIPLDSIYFDFKADGTHIFRFLLLINLCARFKMCKMKKTEL